MNSHNIASTRFPFKLAMSFATSSMHSYICIVAPHLGTIDAPREGRDVGGEPDGNVWCTYPEDEKNLEYMLEPVILAKLSVI